MPDQVIRKVVRDVIREELPPFEQRIKTDIITAVREMIGEFRQEMNKNFDAVMGRMNKYDEEHEILRAQHHRVIDHEERIEKLEKIHPHSHLPS